MKVNSFAHEYYYSEAVEDSQQLSGEREGDLLPLAPPEEREKREKKREKREIWAEGQVEKRWKIGLATEREKDHRGHDHRSNLIEYERS